MTSATDMNASGGFVPLGNGIYIKKPAADAALSLSAAETPSVILLFGWMSAAMPHLMKYTKTYDDLYPSATQILVLSEPSNFWSSESTARTKMIPLVEALQAFGYIKSEKSCENIEAPLRILTHCFSNGGGFNLSTLHRITPSQQLVTRRRVISALVLDSLPGGGRYKDAKAAIAPTFKNPIVYFFASVLLATLYGIAWITGNLVDGVPLSFLKMPEDLNSENLVGWMDKKTPRLYLYSEKDELIAPDSVHEHAGKAGAKGFNVKLEKFAESKHVAHAKMYPERYWGEIRAVWERAVKGA